MWDVLIQGGEVIDGTRRPRFRADVALQGGRIAAIGQLPADQAKTVIDARGQIVAPGFIDVHNHSDGWLLRIGHQTSKTSQGFTTEILMSDGISYAPVRPPYVTEWMFYLRTLDGLQISDYKGWNSLGDYLATLEGKTAQNFAVQIPFANLRVNACGWRRAPADDVQLRDMRGGVRSGLADGAVALSTGLDYIAQCFSPTDELIETCREMAGAGTPYVTHMRYKRGVMRGLQEAVAIGKEAGVPVHISHLKGNTEQEVVEILEYIDKVARNEVDLTFDVYPYQPGSTMLNYLLPYEVWEDGPLGVLPKLLDPGVRARFAGSIANYKLELDQIRIAWLQSKDNSRHQGKLLSEYVAESGLPPFEALANLLIEEHLTALLVFIEGDDALVRPFLQHDLYMMGSDGIFQLDGQIHPRQYGSAPRLLGPCVRDWKLFSLEDAVYKLSLAAARRFQLADRGELAEGKWGDVVVFDPATVTDRATYDSPHEMAAGIDHVLVNGESVIRDGSPIDQFAQWPGRALRRGVAG